MPFPPVSMFRLRSIAMLLGRLCQQLPQDISLSPKPYFTRMVQCITTADPFELRDDGCPISITADEEFVARHARLLRTSLNSLSSIVLEMQTVETASNV